MIKLICLNVVSIFIYQTISAQQAPELINSADVIAQGTKQNDDGNYKNAIKLYSKISRSDTNYSDALHELAYSSYLDSQFNESINYAEKGLELFPENSADWYSQIANAYDALTRHADAISYYDSSLKFNPYSFLTWFNKGIAFYNFNKLEDAKTCFQKTILINPYHASSHYYLGYICYRQGKIPQAMLSFSTNLLINPDNRYKSQSIYYLSCLSKVTDEVNENVSKAVASTDDNFDLQQEIILSKISLDTNINYRLMLKIQSHASYRCCLKSCSLMQVIRASGINTMHRYLVSYTRMENLMH